MQFLSSTTRLSAALGLLSLLGCRAVELEDGSGGGSSSSTSVASTVVSSSATGGAAACTLLGGEMPSGCTIDPSPPTVVTGATTQTASMGLVNLDPQSSGWSGFACGFGDSTLGSLTFSGGVSGQCQRFKTDAELANPSFSTIPGDSGLVVVDGRGDNALIALEIGHSVAEFSATDQPMFGVLRSDNQIPWMRPFFESATVFGATYGGHLMMNGDVAYLDILDEGEQGTLDFGDGFTAVAESAGRKVFVVRRDGATGKTIAMHRFDVPNNVIETRFLESPAGELSLLFAGADSGSTDWWTRWYTWSDSDPVLRVSLASTSVASAVVDEQGNLWTAVASSITRYQRDGSCSTVQGFNPTLFPFRLGLMPNGHILALLSNFTTESNVAGCVLHNTGSPNYGDLFIAELDADGQFVEMHPIDETLAFGFGPFLGITNDRAAFFAISDLNMDSYQDHQSVGLVHLK